MLFKDKVLIHNGEEYIKDENGYGISRVPLSVREHMTPAGKNTASVGWTGVEIRFVIEKGNEATVTVFRPEPNPNWFAVAMLYLGNFQYGWTYLFPYVLTPGINRIKVTLPDNMPQLRELSEEYGYPFSADVVRMMFIGGSYRLVDIEGEVRPPKAEEMPDKKAVFYGSSITHGSLSNNPGTNYVALCGKKLGIDVLNKGMAGACFMEPEMIDYILSFDDAQFFSVEVGTNCNGPLDIDELRKRTKYLTDSFVKKYSSKHLFVIDGLWTQKKHDNCRTMVKEITEQSGCERIHYIPGLSLIPDRRFVSADGIHPTAEGQHKIADVAAEIYKQALK